MLLGSSAFQPRSSMMKCNLHESINRHFNVFHKAFHRFSKIQYRRLSSKIVGHSSLSIIRMVESRRMRFLNE
jgi:hypothetical protein